MSVDETVMINGTQTVLSYFDYEVLRIAHSAAFFPVFLVTGILPGPSEPKLTANTFLEPLVRELQALWACKERFSVHGSFFKRPIKVGLICVSSDIPATRKIGGFLGHMSSQGCSRCKKSFGSRDGLDFSGFDRENWSPRTSSEHKCSAKRTMDETSPTAQQKLCSQLGARYSVLQELDYFDCICCGPHAQSLSGNSQTHHEKCVA